MTNMTNRNRQDTAGKRNRSGRDRSASAVRKRAAVLRLVLLAGTVLVGAHTSPAYGQGSDLDAAKTLLSNIKQTNPVSGDCGTALGKCRAALEPIRDEPVPRQETITYYACRGERPASTSLVNGLDEEGIILPVRGLWTSFQPVEGAECTKQQYVVTFYDFVSTIRSGGEAACQSKFDQCVLDQKSEVCLLWPVWDPKTGMSRYTGTGVVQGTDKTCSCYKDDNSRWIRKGSTDEICKPFLLPTG